MKQFWKELNKKERAILKMLIITLIADIGIAFIFECFANSIGKYLPYAVIIMAVALIVEAVISIRFISKEHKN